MTKPAMPPELVELMLRYSQLGRLLPAQDDFDPADADARAAAIIVLREMDRVRARIDKFLHAKALSPRVPSRQ